MRFVSVWPWVRSPQGGFYCEWQASVRKQGIMVACKMLRHCAPPVLWAAQCFVRRVSVWSWVRSSQGAFHCEWQASVRKQGIMVAGKMLRHCAPPVLRAA